MIKVNYAELHGPLFISGKNFTGKLETHNNPDLKMFYNREEKELIVLYKGGGTMTPRENCKNITFSNPSDYLLTEDYHWGVQATPVNTHRDHGKAPLKAQVGGPNEVKFQAQVETPQDKVQGKPTRKAKFQGEEAQGE